MYFCIFLYAFGRQIYIFATTKFGVKNIDVICLTVLIPLKNLHTARRKAIFIMFRSIFVVIAETLCISIHTFGQGQVSKEKKFETLQTM